MTSFDLKAAALAVGTVMVVPYIFLYDLVILAVADTGRYAGTCDRGPADRDLSPVEGSRRIRGRAGVSDHAASKAHADADRLDAAMGINSCLSSHALAATHPCGNC
jgi:hypothetical protein